MNKQKLSQLVLIPTEYEWNKMKGWLEVHAPDFLSDTNLRFELIGFGPVVSAARTAQLLSTYDPNVVTLIGIAGLYSTALSQATKVGVGEAMAFDSVACYGIGAGSGDRFQTAGELGWQLWKSESGESIGDSISLSTAVKSANENRRLLTVCSAAEGKTDIAQRLSKFPGVIGEDMEGFAVAAACRLVGDQCQIIRGFSNFAGDRDHANWKVDEAIEAACKLLVDQT